MKKGARNLRERGGQNSENQKQTLLLRQAKRNIKCLNNLANYDWSFDDIYYILVKSEILIIFLACTGYMVAYLYLIIIIMLLTLLILIHMM